MPSISGIARNQDGSPISRLVRAYRQVDGKLAGQAVSGEDGEFSVEVPTAQKHFVVVHDVPEFFALYLPMNGENDSVDFSEWNGKAVSVFGGAHLSTAQSKFGGSSASFDGSGDYLVIPHSPDFDFGTGDFTVEAWINTDRANTVIYEQRNGLVSGAAYFISATGKIGFYCLSQALIVEGATDLTGGVWHHVAWSRGGGYLKMFVDGVLEHSEPHAYELTSTAPVVIGANNTFGDNFKGHIDDLCVTQGVARYTANFTPPAAPHLPAGDARNALIFDHLRPV